MRRIHLSSSENLNKNVSYIHSVAADYPLKPCGLWYAIENEWQKWCDAHPESKNYTGYKYSYELDVDMSKVIILDDVKPTMEFHWKYGYKYNVGNFTVIDWVKVAKDYSGIEIRNYDALYSACSFMAVIWLRNWAVSGGCIWDLEAVKWQTPKSIIYN